MQNNGNKSLWRRTKVKNFSVAVLTLLIIVFVFLRWLAPHFLPSLFTSVAVPFWRAEFSVASGSLQSPQQLLDENESLKLQLAADELRLNTVRSVELENAELKDLLGRSVDVSIFNAGGTGADATSTQTASSSIGVSREYATFLRMISSQKPAQSRIISPILMRPPFVPYDELIIDGGSDIGFSTGDKVYAPGNVLIGKIVDTLNRTSKVILFSSPGQTYQVMLASSSVSITAIGRGGGQYSAQVSRDISVKAGDFIINPSLNDRAFGVVFHVIADPTQPFQTVLFAPPVNLYQLKWVMIDKSK
ncbi:hypothetical protein KGQ27_01095 [Patescibacteria group bacterium]|nr:hypothetical protein [Patescibacteria group bacterium]MDE1946558.1 hypothetical protein [Patescibacteria group bacterium]MDE2010881.1 hypothetical protein [Patescibacteria group bacterium]MDE2232765.1 hypothetical protein [Patescibacteria group bacterium]